MTIGATPTVTVILPTCDRAKLLPRAIKSVLSQSYEDLELIVVDDASTDDTQTVVQQVGDRRVRYFRLADRQGATAARNAGISAARGEFIGFQDSDDEWLSGKLEKQMAVFRDGGQSVDIVYCGFQRIMGRSVIVVPGPHVAVKEGDLSRTIFYENIVSTQTLIIRSRCLENVGPFLDNLPRFQDWELVMRLAQEYEFHFVNECLVRVFDTPGNITSDDLAGARALQMILDRHRATINSDRRAHARILRLLGLYKSLSGSQACDHFLKSLELEPDNLKTWGLAVLSLFGTRTVRSVVTLRQYRRLKENRSSSGRTSVRLSPADQ